MNILRHLAISFLALSVATSVSAQSNAVQNAIEQIIEKSATLENADVSLDVLYETLTAYSQNPLNLNTASLEELMQLGILSDFQASSIREYIATYGDMKTPYELQFAYGITQETMLLLLPFVCTKPTGRDQPTLKTMLTRGLHTVLLRAKQTLETERGYSDGQYLGSPQSLYVRYRYHFSDRIQWGFTADKDAGEPFGGRYNKAGFDFYSGHVQASKFGRLQNVVIGDYCAQFGQGLLLWQGGSLGKSSNAFSAAKRAGGIRAYTGANENNFFRGVATSINITKNLGAIVFFSYKNIDANADTLNVFSTMQISGLHNTPALMAGKDAVSELATGANILMRFKRLRIGVNGIWYRFGGEFQRDNAPYRYFELNRNENTNLSADYRCILRKVNFFGEAGVSQNGGWATLNGCAADVAPALQVVLLHRYYRPQYQAYYSSAFSESGKTANENGFYIGANIDFHLKWRASGYFDAASFEWLRYRSMSPSRGFDFLLQTDYTPNSSTLMYVRLRCDNKQENISTTELHNRIVDDVRKTHIRYNISYQLTSTLRCETRVEAALYKVRNDIDESGLMAFQSVQYSFRKVAFSLRYAMFNTDSYASAIYAYENDAAYSFTVPAYYGKGSRWYINLQWQPTEHLNVWLRCAQTMYYDRDFTGDSASRIDAPHNTDVKIQVRVKF